MVMEFVEKSWNSYKKNFWQITGGLIFTYAIIFGLLLVFMLSFTLSLYSFSRMNFSENTMMTVILQLMSAPLSFLLLVFGACVVGVVLIVLTGGLVGLYYQALKGKAHWKTVFVTARKKFWSILGANLITVSIMGLVALFIFMPVMFVEAGLGIWNLGIIFAGMTGLLVIGIFFVLVNQSIVIDNKGAVEAVKNSYRVARKNFFGLFLLVIIFGVMNLILSLIPRIGFVLNILFTTPIAGLAYTAFYLDRRKR